MHCCCCCSTQSWGLVGLLLDNCCLGILPAAVVKEVNTSLPRHHSHQDRSPPPTHHHTLHPPLRTALHAPSRTSHLKPQGCCYSCWCTPSRPSPTQPAPSVAPGPRAMKREMADPFRGCPCGFRPACKRHAIIMKKASRTPG